MHLLIAYSSVTGNTRRLAQGIARELQEFHPQLADIKELTGLLPADVYLVGYWADKGHADDLAAGFLRQLKGVKVGLFGTLGAYPYSRHGRDIMTAAESLLDESCTCIGSFICQGTVDPSLLERMQARSDPLSPAAPLRHRIAAMHPNKTDMQFAAAMFGERLQAL